MKIIAVGKNYACHALEFDGTSEKPEFPMIFMKPDSAILKNGKHFYIRCSKALVESQQDNENIVREVIKGDNGIEYTCIRQKDEVTYIWEDEVGMYYYVSGNIQEEELKRVMMSLQEDEQK